MPKKSIKDLKPGQVMWLERGIFVRRTKSKELRYGISYCYKGERIQEITGASKTHARKALAVRQAEIAQGRYNFAIKKKSPSILELCDKYLEHAKEHKRSWKRDAGVIKKIKVFFGPKRIDQITTWDIQRYQKKSTETVSQASANRELAIIKRMFTLAITWGMINNNPASEVKLYREPERNIRTLNQEEQDSLINACPESIRPLVITALHTGMRRSELFNLTWDNVDLDRLLITVEKTKSGRIRHIPINGTVKMTLTCLPGPREGFIFKWKGKHFESIQKPFNRALKISGIRKCRFHDLRHTFATNLVLGGIDLVTVMELMGHADIKMTMRYAHPTPEAKRIAVEILDAKFDKYKQTNMIHDIA